MTSNYEKSSSGAWKREKRPKPATKEAIDPPTHQESRATPEVNVEVPDSGNTILKERTSGNGKSHPRKKAFAPNTLEGPPSTLATNSSLQMPSPQTSHPHTSTVADRRATLIVRREMRAKESSLQRDAEIMAAKARHLSYVKRLDEDLEEDLEELDGELGRNYSRRADSCAMEEKIDEHSTKQEKRRFSAFNLGGNESEPCIIESPEKKKFVPFQLPVNKASQGMPEEPMLSDSQISVTNIDSTSNIVTSTNSSFEQASVPNFEPPSTDPDTPIPKFIKSFTTTSFSSETTQFHSQSHIHSASESFTSEPSPSPTPKKRKAAPNSSSPSKKPHMATDEVPSYIELDPIRPRLMNYPFCFISAWNLEIIDENLKLLRKMAEKHGFFPEAVRADKTGYFLIFESSEKGEAAAEKCCKHFKKWKFRETHMYMVFVKRGRAVDGLE